VIFLEKKSKEIKILIWVGTMRIGGQVCKLKKSSNAYKMYKNEEIVERHRHRYEVNPNYIDQLIWCRSRYCRKIKGWKAC
jgi:CTP synthase